MNFLDFLKNFVISFSWKNVILLLIFHHQPHIWEKRNFLQANNITWLVKGFIPPTPLTFHNSPFPEIQDFPTCYRPIWKTKVLKDSCNQFLYNFYLQSILIWEEYLYICIQKCFKYLQKPLNVFLLFL